jgi:hypothetical protein
MFMFFFNTNGKKIGESQSDYERRKKNEARVNVSVGWAGYGTYMCKGCGKRGIPKGHSCPKCE